MSRTIFIGVLPPPVNGMTTITSIVLKHLGSEHHLSLAIQRKPSHTELTWRVAKYFGLIRYSFLACALRWQGYRKIYFVPDSDSGLIFSCICIGILRLARFELFLHHHVYSYVSKRQPVFSLLVWLSGRQTVHIVLGEQMQQLMLQMYRGIKRVVLLSNAIAQPSPRLSRAEREAGPIVVGFLSNITLDKGFDVVLSTLEAARNGNTSVRLLLAGPIRDDCREQLRTALLDYPDHVAYLGPLYGQEKEAFLDQLDIFLFPSRYRNEAAPLVVYEALAHGVPVVATRAGMIADIVGDAGFVVASESEFVSKFEYLVSKMAESDQAYSQFRNSAVARADELAKLAAEELKFVLDALRH